MFVEKVIIQSFKDLIVWQKSVQLSTTIYNLTLRLPKEELFGLSSQMRRSAVSIASNIAEGRMRGTKKDFVQFLRISLGSVAELQTQIMILKTLTFGSNLNYNEAESLIEEITKMLKSMISKLKS